MNLNEYYKKGFGRERAWIDFANSLEWNGFGKVQDLLSTPNWLPLFLGHWEFAPRVPANTPNGELVKLREILRGLAEKIAAGGRPASSDITALNSWLKVPLQQTAVQRQDGLRLSLAPIHGGWPWILSRIAASFVETLQEGESARVKMCANEGCRWIFYDQTKGRTRRWCSDRSCGNRDRVRRARAAAKKKK